MPEVIVGFSVSKGMPFLFTVMAALSSVSLAILPLRPRGRKSTSMR